RDERGRARRDDRSESEERDRAAAHRVLVDERLHRSTLVLDRPDLRRGEAGHSLLLADLAQPARHAALRGRMRVHAGAGGPLRAVDHELRLVGVVAEQWELLEAGPEAELPERVGDRFGRTLCRRRPCLANADLHAERLEEVHPRQSRCAASLSSRRMKVGIVVPYSWSFWGAVVEHAELQAAALQKDHEYGTTMPTF